MHLRSSFSLEELTDACEVMLRHFGYVSHKALAKEFNVTRQAIQLRLRRAQARKELSEALYERYSMTKAESSISHEFMISEANDAFLTRQAEYHQLRPSAIVDAALTRYRHSIGA